MQVLTYHTPYMMLQSLSLWFHPSLYLFALFLPYLSFRCCSHSLIHSLPLSVLHFLSSYPPPSHLLCLFQMCNISLYLLLTSCTFLFLPLSQHLHSLFPFWYPPLAKSPHSICEHISRLPSLYLSPPYLDLPPSLSMHAYLSVSALSQSQWAQLSYEEGAEGGMNLKW